jgi:hypothetical protein
VVEPYARLDHVTVLRLFDYGLSAIVAPEAPGHILPQGHDKGHAAGPGAEPDGPGLPVPAQIGHG